MDADPHPLAALSGELDIRIVAPMALRSQYLNATYMILIDGSSCSVEVPALGVEMPDQDEERLFTDEEETADAGAHLPTVDDREVYQHPATLT